MTDTLQFVPDWDNPGDYILEVTPEFRARFGFDNDIKAKILRIIRNNQECYMGRIYEPRLYTVPLCTTPEESCELIRQQILHDLAQLLKQAVQIKLVREGAK